MKVLLLADQMVRSLARWAFLAAAVLLLLLGLIGFVDVISTNTVLIPVKGLVEVSGALLAVIVFLGLAEAQAEGANITIDILTDRMGPRARRACDIATLTICTAFMAVLTWYTASLALSAWRYNEVALGALPFPMTPGKVAAFVGAAIATGEFARQLARAAILPSTQARKRQP